MENETIFPNEQLDAASAELANLRKHARRETVDPFPSQFDHASSASLLPTLLMILCIEVRELRRTVFELASQVAAPLECEHPLEARINEGRMGQPAGTAFHCTACNKHFLDGQEIHP